jgi:uncharacterized protein (TIGR00730 family)
MELVLQVIPCFNCHIVLILSHIVSFSCFIRVSGVMGGVNQGCDRYQGQVRGIIHEKFCVDFGEHPHIKDLIICRGSDLAERKQALLDHSDCIIVMPGGVGTFDEFWDCVCGKSLGMKGMNRKPICVVNMDGFYDGFLMQMRRAHKEGILYGQVETYFHVEENPIKALDWCHHTASQDDALKQMNSLIDHIKENNVEDRVKERKTLPVTPAEAIKEVKEKVLKVEEYVLDTAPDYKGFVMGIAIGLFAGVIIASENVIPQYI